MNEAQKQETNQEIRKLQYLWEKTNDSMKIKEKEKQE